MHRASACALPYYFGLFKRAAWFRVRCVFLLHGASLAHFLSSAHTSVHIARFIFAGWLAIAGRRKLRRVAAKEEDEADEDDLALVAEAAEDGAVQLDARTKARIAQKLRKGGEEEDANGAGSGLATGDDAAAFGLSAATIAAANREAGKGKAGDDGGAEAEDEGPAAPSAFDKDYDSDEMDVSRCSFCR